MWQFGKAWIVFPLGPVAPLAMDLTMFTVPHEMVQWFKLLVAKPDDLSHYVKSALWDG